jgi:hypothetical protein
MRDLLANVFSASPSTSHNDPSNNPKETSIDAHHGQGTVERDQSPLRTATPESISDHEEKPMLPSSEENTDDDEPATHVEIALPHKLVRHGFAHSTDRARRKTPWIVPVKYAEPTDGDYSRAHPTRYESPDPEFEMFIDLGERRLVSDTVDVRWLYPDHAGHLAYIVKTPENDPKKPQGDYRWNKICWEVPLHGRDFGGLLEDEGTSRGRAALHVGSPGESRRTHANGKCNSQSTRLKRLTHHHYPPSTRTSGRITTYEEKEEGESVSEGAAEVGNVAARGDTRWFWKRGIAMIGSKTWDHPYPSAVAPFPHLPQLRHLRSFPYLSDLFDTCNINDVRNICSFRLASQIVGSPSAGQPACCTI